MTTRRLVMLRHGQTDFNLGSRMQGQLDTELTELGRSLQPRHLPNISRCASCRPICAAHMTLRSHWGSARAYRSRSTAGYGRPISVTGKA
jgi:bisphosphoglycerate-dependent phosphoglycerate mutase